MSEPTKESLYENGRSFDAYYYYFEPTGDYQTDVVLHAIAKAGNAYHSTEDWRTNFGPYSDHLHGSTPIEWIQNAATDAAIASSQMQEQIKELREALLQIEAIENKMIGSDWEEIEEARAIARSALANTERKTA